MPNSLALTCLFNSKNISHQRPLEAGTETELLFKNDANKNEIFLCKEVLVHQLITGGCKTDCEGFDQECDRKTQFILG